MNTQIGIREQLATEMRQRMPSMNCRQREFATFCFELLAPLVLVGGAIAPLAEVIATKCSIESVMIGLSAAEFDAVWPVILDVVEAVLCTEEKENEICRP